MPRGLSFWTTIYTLPSSRCLSKGASPNLLQRVLITITEDSPPPQCDDQEDEVSARESFCWCAWCLMTFLASALRLYLPTNHASRDDDLVSMAAKSLMVSTLFCCSSYMRRCPTTFLPFWISLTGKLAYRDLPTDVALVEVCDVNNAFTATNTRNVSPIYWRCVRIVRGGSIAEP